jgi:hypothetical protein
LTGGKTLGDLAKGFQGEPTGSNIAAYAANALGLPKAFGADFGKTLDEVTRLVGTERESMGASYASKGSPNSSDSKSENLDFGKMMEGLLKQMSPEEAAKNDSKENPAEAVFRRLDLLPADKIESNKDISLFVRIGYRYRKKSSTIEGNALEPAPQSKH